MQLPAESGISLEALKEVVRDYLVRLPARRVGGTKTNVECYTLVSTVT